jgi:diguanylate cyclase (GGDEF)-like protein
MPTRRVVAPVLCLAGALLLSAAYLLIDNELFHIVGYDGMELFAAVAVFAGAARFRPDQRDAWSVLGVALLFDFLGEVLWDAGWKSSGSVPDLAYLTAYVLGAIAIVKLVRATADGHDIDDFLDVVIVAVGFGLLAVEFLVEPAVSVSGEAMARFTAVVYPLIGVAVLFTLLRLSVHRNRRVPALWLLLGAIGIRLVADLVYSWDTLYGAYHEGALLDTLWILNSACFAAAALHPSMRLLTAGQRVRPRIEDARIRLASIAMAAVAIPLVVVLHESFRKQQRPWMAAGIAGLEVLVVLRVARLLRWRLRAEADLAQALARQAAVAELGRLAVEGAEPERLEFAAVDFRSRLEGKNDADFVDGLEAVLAAATARHTAESQLAHQALHDPLTGLPNRALFLDRVELARDRSRRHHQAFALLFLDLDHFKVINDSLGHQAGDQLLIEVARRLSLCARSGDTVARFGGDEFAVLCDQLAHDGDALAVAERIVSALRQPISIHGESVVVTASVGIAIGDDHSTAGALLRDADAAMYRAKDAGRDRVEVFDDLMRARAMRRLTVEQDLRAALGRGELVVHYQPTVDLRTRRMVGHEALLRWQHPTRGLLAPDEFLDVAEETGLITRIGGFVIDRVLADMADADAQPSLACGSVAINVSMRQLTDLDLAVLVARALDVYQVDPHRLCLEVTEHALARDPDRTAAVLADLTALGVDIAVDDFGTGYSSLTHLRHFHVDVLKIDHSFVAGLGTDADDTAIVQAVIGLGHALGLLVVAEGVEREDQVDALLAAGCDHGQGRYFAAPAPLPPAVAV